ncbi:methionyl-tRNA formyltransferase [Cochleicola gelatinilyticus]|uniref:Methionyl-tRNA formyltransferase n=1 Tax=Cochleicola gelatinilyticus TaxID=1763537 RepID=A0A167HS74_9FLAO|nr:methionyl-tRNA formyltransferase [Cochleicola gelatinilyticus]OAB78910.1 methionyl-tRNA formyltransferase [Cochleicola gelatinilyticus]
MKELRIVFMGTPGFAVGVLEQLVAEGKHIVGVITAPDRPAGRGRKLTPSAVKEFATKKGLKVLQPTNLKSVDFLEELRALNANLQIVVAFRMLPKVVWSMPEYGTFNLHASLLPSYRGAAPINWAVINGEKKTGVTTFFIDEKIDTGEIIATSEVDIAPNETAGSLHDTLMIVGSDLVIETVNRIEQGSVKTTAQPKTTQLKEAPKLTPENTRIDWSHSSSVIHAFVRGLSPYPVAWTKLKNGKDTLKMKIYASEGVIESHNYKSGTVFTTKKEIKVATKDGYLYIKELQLPGKRKMEAASLLNGFEFASEAKVM